MIAALKKYSIAAAKKILSVVGYEIIRPVNIHNDEVKQTGRVMIVKKSK